MKENQVSGTKGYAEVQQRFIDATLAIGFTELHKDFLPFFPKSGSRILDIGAGIGRDASMFAAMGHVVVAVEPLKEFRTTGKRLYDSPNIEWIDDALPNLATLGENTNGFDGILLSGVWHHLDSVEQHRSMQRIAQLLNSNGVLLLTLRNGPAGAGTHVFPTDGKTTVSQAEHCGLTTLLFLENQPSSMKNKEDVSWTKLAFIKKGVGR